MSGHYSNNLSKLLGIASKLVLLNLLSSSFQHSLLTPTTVTVIVCCTVMIPMDTMAASQQSAKTGRSPQSAPRTVVSDALAAPHDNNYDLASPCSLPVLRTRDPDRAPVRVPVPTPPRTGHGCVQRHPRRAAPLLLCPPPAAPPRRRRPRPGCAAGPTGLCAARWDALTRSGARGTLPRRAGQSQSRKTAHKRATREEVEQREKGVRVWGARDHSRAAAFATCWVQCRQSLR